MNMIVSFTNTSCQLKRKVYFCKYCKILKNSLFTNTLMGVLSILSPCLYFAKLIVPIEITLTNFDYWLRISVPYSECPTPYSSVFCLRYPTWNSTYTWSSAHLCGVENLRQGMQLSVPCSECPTPYIAVCCGYWKKDTRLYRAIRSET